MKGETEMTRLNLDAFSPEQQIFILSLQKDFSELKSELQEEVTNIYDMVEEFRNPTGDCPTCLLAVNRGGLRASVFPGEQRVRCSSSALER